MHNDHNYCKSQESPTRNDMNISDKSTYIECPTQSLQHSPTVLLSTSAELATYIEHDHHATQKSPPPEQSDTATKQKARLRVASLTPKCRKLYNEYRKSRKLLSFTRRAKRALQFQKLHCFEQVTAGMKPLAKKMLLMQLKLYTKKEKARRFTLEEKLICLSILKQGPKSYRFLQKIFILPSETTLKKLVSKFHIDTGINIQIFDAIKQEVQSWKEDRKLCTLIFDEIALETGLTYTYSDSIKGFVELPNKTKQFADHALVFMIKGVVHKWQQPVAYYFCEGATSAIKLKQMLKDLINAIGETGLIPVALVSDQGASFQSALNSLQEDTRRSQLLQNKLPDDTINICGFDMSVIYDPPHLIKGIRNNFLTKNISLNSKIATWNDIVDVYKTDCQHTESRLMHKLNDELIIPEKIKKMKVKNCVRVFSKTVAGALNFTSAFSHYADGRPVSTKLKNTAELVSFCDDLFDSVNGITKYNKRRKGKQLRTAVTANSKHHAFWQDALKKLNNLKFIYPNGQEKSVPTIKNWICTLKSMQRLWQLLIKNNIKVFKPRYINSDAIENFFGKVRAYNLRNNNPNCHSFVSTFKSLLITGFIKFHQNSFNCEKDESNPLIKIKSLFNNNNLKEQQSTVCGEINESRMELYPVIREARHERVVIQSRAYTAGWVVRKILKKFNCKDCKNNLTTNTHLNVHKWIQCKEYKDDLQKLTYPAEPIVRYFGMILEETNKFLDKNPHLNNVSKNIEYHILKDNDFEHISCQKHKREIVQALLTITVKLCIHNWCTVINRILKGTDIIRLERRRNLPEMQVRAFDKFKKKFKRK